MTTRFVISTNQVVIGSYGYGHFELSYGNSYESCKKIIILAKT